MGDRSRLTLKLKLKGEIEEDGYRKAVEYYQKAGVLRAQSQQGIAQYAAGLTSIDGGTAEQVPSTDTFLDRLEQLDGRLHEPLCIACLRLLYIC